jgi:hypothetical protein
VDALEGDGGDGAAELAVLRRDDVHVLRADDHVHRLVFSKPESTHLKRRPKNFTA